MADAFGPKTSDWSFPEKPYDLRERLFVFACTIVLRELKEARLRLRILRQTGFLTEAHDPVLAESSQLVKIVATVIRNSEVRG